MDGFLALGDLIFQFYNICEKSSGYRKYSSYKRPLEGLLAMQDLLKVLNYRRPLEGILALYGLLALEGIQTIGDLKRLFWL